MNQVSVYIKALWELRKSENPVVRRWWWVTVIALIGLLLLHNYASAYISFLWISSNVAFGTICFVWMLFHPRVLGKSSRTAIGWSRWLTVIAVFGLYVAGQHGNGVSQNFSLSVLLVLVLAASPILFVLFLMFSLFGASIGAFARRRHSDTEHWASAAVVAWWMSIVVVSIVTVLSDAIHLSDNVVASLVMGLPVITLVVTRGLRRVYLNEPRAPLKVLNAALNRLVITVGKGGTSRTVDFRGVAIGLATALVTLTVTRGLTAPVQESVLGSMFRLRRQLVSTLSLLPPPDSHVVVITLDAAARARALTTSSEARVQAEMINKLNHSGARVIMLPAPVLNYEAGKTTETSEEAVASTIADLPILVAAMKQAGNVVLIVPPRQRGSARMRPLVDAARAVGQFGEEPIGPAQIASIPLKWSGDPPAPLLAIAVSHRRPLSVEAVRGSDPAEVEDVNGLLVYCAFPYRAVVDFRMKAFRKEEIPDLLYSAVISGKAIPPLPQGAKQSLDDYLAGKIVYLEPLVHTDVETSNGLMPAYAMLARVTNALASGRTVKPGSHTADVLWILVLGVLIGAMCVGRDPLQASWRVALLMFVNFGYSLVAYIYMDTWADPVNPLITATVAFLLVTQFTFALERDERDRNRALFSRFIAKEFVDELLQTPGGKLALGGEKRTVCVLFADVRNFTGFAESHRPEEVIELMNIYLTALTNALDAYGGLLDKYTGDGLMAFFEVKGDVRTELVRSVNASLAMRDAAVDVSTKLQAAGKKTLEIGIGMHYGEAIVGLVGNEQRQINYTALGHTVVVSARLQTLAEGGDVVVSEPIFTVVSDVFEFTSMSPVFVKGITAEQRPYRVTRAAEA